MLLDNLLCRMRFVHERRLYQYQILIKFQLSSSVSSLCPRDFNEGSMNPYISSSDFEKFFLIPKILFPTFPILKLKY